ELLVESALTNRLAAQPTENNPDSPMAAQRSANADAAVKTAKEVKGKCASFIAFRKSMMGVGFAVPPHGPNGPPSMDAFRQAQNDRFARLTPEQRVQRARQRLALTQKSTNQPPQ